MGVLFGALSLRQSRLSTPTSQMVKAANHALPCWWGRRSDNTQNTQNTHDTHIYQHNHPQKPKSWLLVTQACQLPSSPSRLPAVYLAAKEGQPQGEHLLSPSPHPQLSEPEPETPPLLPHPPAVQTCDWTRSDRPWTGLQCFGVLQNAGASCEAFSAGFNSARWLTSPRWRAARPWRGLVDGQPPVVRIAEIWTR